MYLEDAIESAFEKLREQGMVAHQNFWCCQGCALADLPKKHDGYVFYHAQGYDRVLRGDDLCLYYGTTDGEGAEDIGHKVVSALNEAGLETEWDGDELTAIIVKPTMATSGDLVGEHNEDDEEDDDYYYEDDDEEEDEDLY